MSGTHTLLFPLFIVLLAITAEFVVNGLTSLHAQAYVRINHAMPYRELGSACGKSSLEMLALVAADGPELREICCEIATPAPEDSSGWNSASERAAGTLIGDVFGAASDDRMDERDRRCSRQALDFSADGHATVWRNPDTGLDYWLTPLKTFRSGGGLACRRFRAALLLQSTPVQEVTRSACRQPSGNWLIRN